MSGMSELFPKVVKLVHSQDEAIKTFAVRTLANLCFNHGTSNAPLVGTFELIAYPRNRRKQNTHR
jgi:hypothetical protein